MSDFTAKITAQLDTSKIPSQLSEIQSMAAKQKIKILVDATDVKNINQVTNAFNDLMKLQSRINSTRLKLAGLDSSKDSAQIKELSGQLNRLMADYNNLHSTFSRSFSTNQLDALNRGFETTSNKISVLNAKASDTSGVQKTAAAYKELKNVVSQMDKIQLKIDSLDATKNASEISQLTSQFNSLSSQYIKLKGALNGKLSADQLSQLGMSAAELKNKLALLDAKAQDTQRKLAETINTKMSNGSFESSIAKVTAEYEKLETTGHAKLSQIKADIASLNSIQAEMRSGNLSTEEMITKWNEYETTLQRVRNSLSTVKSETSQLASALQVQHLDNQMKTWLENNTKSAAEFGGAIAKLRAELAALSGSGNGSVNLNALKDIENRFKEIKEQAASAGTLGKTFFSSFGSGFKSIASMYLSPMMLFMQGVSKVKEMYQNVKDIDKAMTGLRRVTNLSADEYTTLYDNMRQSAQSYGATLTDVIDSTTTWVKLGFDADTSNKLAETTVEYQHVTDLDSETAVKNLVTAYKGFQTQLDDVSGGDTSKAVEYVADIYDKLGNEFAVSAANVGSGLTKCASTLSLAGNTIEQSAAMVTGITEVTQNPDKAGNALKILSLRLRGMKGDLEELGEDVDENVESISKMQTQVLNLTHGKVNIFDDNGNFKSTYEIMKGIAEVYDTLSDTEQAELLETIAGKNRANDVASLITNWKQVEAACTAAYNSEGTAAQENAKYLESIEGRINQLKSAWQGLSADFLSADFVKGSVDGLRNIVSGINTLTNSIGAIPTILGGIAAFTGLKTLFKTIGDKGGLAYLLKTVSALPTPVKVATVAIAGLAIVGKKLYENWYNNNFKWSEGLTEVADKATASYDKVKSLSDLKKEIGKLDLVIKSDKSSTADITQAQQRLQEISQLVKDEYGITVTADTSQLDAAIEKVEKIQLSEARGNQSTLDNDLSSKVIKYNESINEFPELEKQFLETQDKSTRYNKAVNKFYELMDTYSDRASNPESMKKWIDTVNGWLDLYNIDKESVGRLSENENNANVQSMLEIYAKQYQDDVAEGKKHNLRAKYDDLNNSINEFETSRDKFVQNGLIELSRGDEAEGIKQLTSAVKDYGASAEEVAMSASKAKHGIESFTELNGDTERINQAIKSYSNYAKQFGATSEEIVEGSALIANGFDSAEVAVAAGDEAISNVLSDMKSFGEDNDLFKGMNTDGISAKLTEMAQAMDLLPDTKHIEIDAEGNINVIDDIKNKIDELDSKGAIKLSVNADGDISVIDSIDQKLVNLSKAGQIDIKFNVDTGGFDINDLQGNNLGEITASGEVVWKSDTSQVKAPNTDPVNVSVNYTKGDQAPPDEQDAKVNYTKGTQAPPDNGNANVDYALGRQAPPKDKTAYVTYVEKGGGTKNKSGGSAGVDGTAHVDGSAFSRGTTGTALKTGDWGTKGSGIALGGELGEELVVRNGKFFTIGSESAEMFSYQKGDIIFNAEQTKQIFEKGRITHGNRRGKAFHSGTAFAKGSESKENFDWIETFSDKVERNINRFTDKFKSAYLTLVNRFTNLGNALSETNNQIGFKQQAYDRYMEQANAVGLDESWAAKVRDGEFDISTVTDDSLKEKIKNYQEWYSKALDCKDAIDDLHESVADLYKENFDNIESAYDNILTSTEHRANMLNEYVDRAEERGLVGSTRYYEALQISENENLEQLKSKQTDLINALNDAINSGEIEIYSDAWYELQNSIDEVTESIEESKTALIEFDNQMRQTSWDRFDYMQDNLSNFTDEADFLIDLLEGTGLYNITDSEVRDIISSMQKNSASWHSSSPETKSSLETENKKLASQIEDITKRDTKIDDDGVWWLGNQALYSLNNDNSYGLSDNGMSVMGLHGLKYDVFMEQASLYASEIEKINAQIAKTPYDTTLIERRQELLELQRESILAANDEKDAMISLIKDGIEEQVDALEDLIDAYIDSLDSAKDLYDYQKKIKEHTKDIASLEKQLSAYQNDTSEETKAKIQKIKVDLEEARQDLKDTEYDKYISDQKDLLEDLYDEYESLMNEHMEDINISIEKLVSDVNANASIINKTLTRETSKVGTELSAEMKSVWTSESQALTTYFGDTGIILNGVSGYFENTNTTLSGINTTLTTIMNDVNSIVGYASYQARVDIDPEGSKNQMIQNSLDWWATDDDGIRNSLASDNEKYGAAFGYTKNDGSWYDSDGNLAYSISNDDKIRNVIAKMETNSAAWQGASDNERTRLAKANENYAKKIQSLTDQPVYKDGNGVWWIGDRELYSYKSGGIANFTGAAWLDGTPSKPELVLNAKDTENFLELKDVLNKMKSQKLSIIGQPENMNTYGIDISPQIRNIPDIHRRLAEFDKPVIQQTVNLGGIDINIDHVQDYNDFVRQLQHDKKFDDMIADMTIGKIAGGSSLAKRKYRF